MPPLHIYTGIKLGIPTAPKIHQHNIPDPIGSMNMDSLPIQLNVPQC
uniref:Uncharacterized protein n=1 Tax=Anguilla anguilla TaxID=7936 RepID=A0A0E9PR97_ANGAN